MDSIRKTVTRLLGREPEAADGIAAADIDEALKASGIALPPPLSLFYRLAGNDEALMRGFNYFALPAELEKRDGLILFLCENQAVCHWGFDPDDGDDPMVYTFLEGTGEWISEMPLSRFLVMVLYYQCCQGGYDFCGTIALEPEELQKRLETAWETVVHMNGLFVACRPDCLIWRLEDRDGHIRDDTVYFSARTQEAYEANEAEYALEWL